jgi:hypothetical protein
VFTVTVPGTPALPLLLPSDTLVLLATFPLKVTAQLEDAGVVTVAGLQVRFVRLMPDCVMVTDTLPPVIGMLLPPPSDADAPEMLTNADGSPVLAI